MIQLQKDKSNVLLSIATQLDREDVQELVSDLNKWLEDTAPMPKFKGIDEKEVRKAWIHSKQLREAKEQNDSKNKLGEEMRRMFVDVLDTEYLETKFATVYKLDEINREVEILRKKLNKQ